MFGEEVARLVDGMTKLSRMELQSREQREAENFRKMIVAMAKDIRVILIKLADRLHNMRTLSHLSPEKQKRIAQETLDIYAPLANRLGISKIKTELEDLSFMYLNPEAYQDLVQKVTQRRVERESYINELIDVMKRQLAEHGYKGEVKGRPKHFYSIYQKMQKQGIAFEDIYDLIAIRIITDTKVNCYAILGLIHSLWTPVPGRFKDFIGVPKSNLYQSLHTTVIGPKGERVEFQIRTEEMHRLAEEGIAAHWRYKEKSAISQREEQQFAWLRQLLEWQKDVTGRQGVHGYGQGRPVPGRRLCIHAERGRERAAPGVDARGFRLCRAYRYRPPVRRRQDQRKDRSDQTRPSQRRPDRDHYAGRPYAEPRLAQVRQDIKGAHQDQGLGQDGRAEEEHPSRERTARQGPAEVRTQSVKGVQIGELPVVANELSQNAIEDLLASIGYGIVSTPDHWHALMTILACAAGKDVYVEKPLTHVVREGEWMHGGGRRAQRVVQVGTQQRSGRTTSALRRAASQRPPRRRPHAHIRRYRNIVPGFTQAARRAASRPRRGTCGSGPRPSCRSTRAAPLPLPLVLGLLGRADHEPPGARRSTSSSGFTGAKPVRVSAFGRRRSLEGFGETPDVFEAIYEYPGFLPTWSSSRGLGERRRRPRVLRHARER